MDKHPEYLPSEQEVVAHIKHKMIQEFWEEISIDLLNCESEDQAIAIDDLSEHIISVSQIETLDEALVYLKETGHDFLSTARLVVEAFRFDKRSQSHLNTMLSLIPTKGWDT